jgi:hypothetical protein
VQPYAELSASGRVAAENDCLAGGGAPRLRETAEEWPVPHGLGTTQIADLPGAVEVNRDRVGIVRVVWLADEQRLRVELHASTLLRPGDRCQSVLVMGLTDDSDPIVAGVIHGGDATRTGAVAPS